MIRHTKEELKADLAALGVERGDILVISADLGKVGFVEGKMHETILNAIMESVGPEGTILVTGFTEHFFLRKIDKQYIFDPKTTPPTSGALSRILFKHPQSKRSTHPTNSFFSLGYLADELLAGHDEKALSYDPVGRAIERGAKMLIIGCVTSSPGFLSVHYSQQYLGLTKKRFLKPARGVYANIDGSVKLFIKRDFGGCAKGFYKFYSHYVMSGELRTGKFGEAISILMPGKTAFNIAVDLLKKDPGFGLCDNPYCGSCRASWSYNKKDYIPYYFRKIFCKFPKTSEH